MADESDSLIRTHLLFTSAQRQRLARIARQEGRSLSGVARSALDIGLAALESQSDQKVRQALQALDDLRQLREKGRARYGVYRGDLVAESRAEREQDSDRI